MPRSTSDSFRDNEVATSTFATPFGTPFFGRTEDGEWRKFSMDELRSQYEAWESKRFASRRQSWADEVEEELFVEEMIEAEEDEEEMAPVVIEKKPAATIEALRAGMMNTISILEENVVHIELAVELAEYTEAVAVVGTMDTASIPEENFMDIDLAAEMAQADISFYDETVSCDTVAAPRLFKVFVDDEAISPCDDISTQPPSTPNIIGADLLRRFATQPDANSMSQDERDALEVEQFLAAVEEENGRKENVDVSGEVVARRGSVEVAGAEREALKELKVKKSKRSSGKRTRVSAESEGENQPKKLSKRKDSGPRHQRLRHTLSSIGNAEK
ncbi:hypothetical protein C8Q76DRAFT_801051 [Earliella scabrosa]|nr:hypothetical protein C8Q76DRAFT_801051 [Earliella scabrosa]